MFTAALSAVPCLAVCALPAFTRSSAYEVEWLPRETESHRLIAGARGLMYVRMVTMWPLQLRGSGPSKHWRLRRLEARDAGAVAEDVAAGRLGFVAIHREWTFAPDPDVEGWRVPSRTAWRSVAAPYWAVAAGLAALPLGVLAPRAWAWRRKRHATKRGRCMKCGYDLRASPGRCPECGSAVGT